MTIHSSVRLVASLAAGAVLVHSAHAQLPAFPGAQGFGAYATGGRSGTVYHVTTLADSGPGSFRDAVSASGRTVVFDVGGYISLSSAVSVKGNITIAGQTAPGGGIGFKGGEISFANSQNIICRYIRIRPGSDTESDTDDALSFYRARNIIVDHVSLEFAPWNNIDGVSDDWQNHPVESITVQNSIIANPTGQQFGAHTESVNGTWSWFNNIFANSHNRNPLAKINTVFINNILYNYQAGYTTHTSTHFKHDIVNNYFIFGPASTGTDNTWYQVDKNQSIYYSGNLKDNNLDGALNGAVTTPYWYQGPGTILTSPWSSWTTNVTILSPAAAYRLAISQSGALPRDPVDSLLADQIKTLGKGSVGTGAGTAGPSGGLYDTQAETGLPDNGYGVIEGGTAPADSDRDGMPDFWELTLGSNVSVDDHGSPVSAGAYIPNIPAGYTLLDEYLHFCAVPHAVAPKNTAEQPGSLDIDLSQYTAGFSANATYALSNATNASVTLLVDGHTARFIANTNFSGRARFDFTVNDGTSMTQTVLVMVSAVGLPRDLVWKGDGVANDWNTNAANFLIGTNPAVFTSGDRVVFDDSGSNIPEINISGAIVIGAMTVDSSKDYAFGGDGFLSGGMTLMKTGAGTTTLKTPNTYFGGTYIDQGSLIIADGGGIGGGPLTIADGTVTLDYAPGTSYTFSGGIVAPDGGVGTLNVSPRATIAGMSGGGTLNLNVSGTTFNFEQLDNSFSGFSGVLNVSGVVPDALLTANFNGGSFDGNLGDAIVNLDNVTIQGRHNSGGNTLTIGALNGTSTATLGGSGYAGNETITVGGKNLDGVFAGSIQNGVSTTSLKKVGSGILTLSGDNSYSGTTTVSAGTLLVNGNNGPSAIGVSSGAILGGDGTVGGLVTVNSGGNLSPGDGVGTLHLAGGLTLNGGKILLDLANVTTIGNGVNDFISMSDGTLTLSGNNSVIPNPLDGALANGTYTLISGGGSTVGSAANLTWSGPSGGRQTFSFNTATPGTIQLIVGGSPAASLFWSGANNGNWDFNSANWLNGAASDRFFNLDKVTFDDSGATGIIQLLGTLQPGLVTVNNSTLPYKFTGAGTLAGPTQLVKNGSGDLILETANSFSGGLVVNSGNVTLTNINSAGSGAITLNGGALTYGGPALASYANSLNITANSTIISAGGNNNTIAGNWAGNGVTATISIPSGFFSVTGTMSDFLGNIALSGSGNFRINIPTGDDYDMSGVAFDTGTGNAKLMNRNGATVTLGSLSGSSETFLAGANSVDAPSIYKIGANNANTTFAGTIKNGTFSSEPSTAIEKIGSGILTLTSANIYSGGTTISQGVLRVNNPAGSATGTGDVLIQPGATLSGDGTIAGMVTFEDDAALAPGDATNPGTLKLNGGLSLSDGTFLNFRLGSTSDQVIVGGSFFLSGILNVTNVEGFGPGVYTLFTFDSTNSVDAGDIVFGNMPQGYDYSIDADSPGALKLVVQSSVPPKFGVVSFAGGNLVMTGSGGAPNGIYYILGTTNLALPREQWSVLATNQFDAEGNFSTTNSVRADAIQRFYSIQLP